MRAKGLVHVSGAVRPSLPCVVMPQSACKRAVNVLLLLPVVHRRGMCNPNISRAPTRVRELPLSKRECRLPGEDPTLER